MTCGDFWGSGDTLFSGYCLHCCFILRNSIELCTYMGLYVMHYKSNPPLNNIQKNVGCICLRGFHIYARFCGAVLCHHSCVRLVSMSGTSGTNRWPLGKHRFPHSSNTEEYPHMCPGRLSSQFSHCFVFFFKYLKACF